MDAASALTVLGEDEKDEQKDSGNDTEGTVSEAKRGSAKKRYLPDHKKPDAAPTFPEKLMAMMRYAETQGDNFCVKWLDDGKSFIIEDPDTFTKKIVPQYFKPTKFSSFTRKLYRWGFRQLNRGMGQDDPVIFGNDYFQRNKPELMARMKSTTAAATRKAEEEMIQTRPAPAAYAGMKRPAEAAQIELQQQLLLSQLLSKKGNFETQSPFASAPPSLYSAASIGNPMHSMMNNGLSDFSLTKMLYPGANLALNAPRRFMSLGHENSLLSQYVPRGMNAAMSCSLPSTAPAPRPNNNMPYYPMASTAEIVQAAIQALKNA
ncbi:hypothetical protein ACA910_001037 [Epithemia clementina (nom. ined.)]